jgi:hypothetical protein
MNRGKPSRRIAQTGHGRRVYFRALAIAHPAESLSSASERNDQRSRNLAWKYSLSSTSLGFVGA